jgi:hypothetical protein
LDTQPETFSYASGFDFFTLSPKRLNQKFGRSSKFLVRETRRRGCGVLGSGSEAESVAEAGAPGDGGVAGAGDALDLEFAAFDEAFGTELGGEEGVVAFVAFVDLLVAVVEVHAEFFVEGGCFLEQAKGGAVGREGLGDIFE